VACGAIMSVQCFGKIGQLIRKLNCGHVQYTVRQSYFLSLRKESMLFRLSRLSDSLLCPSFCFVPILADTQRVSMPRH